MSKHQVVIVGGGFGGLFAAKRLARTDVDVTLIDRTNHHLFQPLLYQLATGLVSEGDIAAPLREVLREQQNASVVLGEVVAVDVASRRLTVQTLDRVSEVSYDSLIVATGASQSYFGHPEFSHHAPGMKTIDDALELRGRIFGAFEMAERECDASARRRWLTFVVVGAGPTGVELAGQLIELSRHSLRGNFRRIDPAEARIVLLDAAPTILGAFPDSLRERGARDLQDLGVEIHLHTIVTGVDERGVETNSLDPRLRRIEAATKIWAAGVQASPLGRILARTAGAELDRAGRVKVEPDCTLPGHSEVFIVGDLMSLNALPGVCASRYSVGPPCGGHHSAPHRRRPHAAAVPLPRSRVDGDHLAVPRARRDRPSTRGGLRGLVAVARRPPCGAHRIQEPPLCPLQLDYRFPRRGTRRARSY